MEHADKVTVNKATLNSNPKFTQVLKANLDIVPESKDLKFYNTGYLARHGNSARKTQAGIKVQQLLEPDQKEQNEKELIATIEHADLKEAQEGLQILREWGTEAGVVGEYVDKAKGKWPEAEGLFK
jgi:hypothetical protein